MIDRGCGRAPLSALSTFRLWAGLVHFTLNHHPRPPQDPKARAMPLVTTPLVDEHNPCYCPTTSARVYLDCLRTREALARALLRRALRRRAAPLARLRPPLRLRSAPRISARVVLAAPLVRDSRRLVQHAHESEPELCVELGLERLISAHARAIFARHRRRIVRARRAGVPDPDLLPRAHWPLTIVPAGAGAHHHPCT
jgi:hypothetical protein